MNLTDEERIRCNECLKRLYQTKLICIQSIQYLIEQQREIDECITDLKSTKLHAQEINDQISELKPISCLKLCCFKRTQPSFETNFNDENHLLILPFPNDPSHLTHSIYGLNELEKDLELEKLFNSLKNSYPIFFTKDQFEHTLHEEYTQLLELAKKLTKCIQILHDTIEFLGIDIKLTLDHMQLAQPRMRQLLKIQAPVAFAQAHKELMT